LAIDLRTGGRCEEPAAGGRVPFDWCNRDPVQVAWTADRTRPVGIAMAGRAVPLSVDPGSLPQRAQVHGGQLALIAPRADDPRAAGPLWFGSSDDATLPWIARGVNACEILDGGRCLFATSDVTRREEAHVYEAGRRAVWNLLEGQDSLPPLDPALRGRQEI